MAQPNAAVHLGQLCGKQNLTETCCAKKGVRVGVPFIIPIYFE